MKKQKLKNYLKFGILLFGISFLLTNCEKDLAEDIDYQQKSRFNVQTLNQEEIQSNSSISRKLNELNPKEKDKQSTNSQAREVYSPEYGFTINTDFVKYIEDTESGNHSYSFPITRDNPTDDKLENLLLHSNLENGYDAYIIQYGFTANEYTSLEENSINNYNTLLFPIDFDTSVFNNGELAKMVYECSETWTYTTYTGHENGELHGVNSDGTCSIGCNYGTSEWVLTGISCGYYDDGSGGGGGGTSIGTGSGGGGGGGTSSDPTDPNYDPTDPNIHGNGGNNNPVISAPAVEDFQDNNPKKLKILTQHPQIKAKITELKGKTSENREYGYQFNISGNNPITYNPIEGELASDNQGIKFPPASIFTQLEMHTHYDGLDNAFSASDLYNMTKLSADSNNPEATAILVAPNGKLFALKVTNQAKADAFKALNEQEGEIKMEEYYYRYVIRWAQIKCNGCTETEFENLINNYLVYYLTQIWDSGLTLYEATEDSDGNITWNEVTYTP